MTTPTSLIPPSVSGRARPFGRLPFAFAPRFFVLMLLGFLWLIPAFFSRQLAPAIFLWDALLLAVWLADLLRLPNPRELEVRRAWQHPPSLAHTSEVSLAVHNHSKASLRCSLTDETPTSLRNAPPDLSLVAPPSDDSSVFYKIIPRKRGDVRLGKVFLRYQSALGFAERRAVAEIPQTVRVLPDMEQARQQALYLIRSRQVEMEKRRKRRRGQGREFESLREYRSGDEMRDICWTATARRNQLTTRLFEIERSQSVWIVLDAGRLLRSEVIQANSEVRLAKLDYAVNAALSLAQVASQCGDRVGLLAYGRNIQQNLAAGRGPLHLRKIVDCLAQVRGEGAEADHARAARVLLTEQSRRSLIVWITDFAETPTTPEVIEYAAQMKSRHLVMFTAMSQPDLSALAEAIPQTPEEMFRHTAALEITQRRDILLRGLRQRGVFAFELSPGLLASSIVNQYLDIKERNLL